MTGWVLEWVFDWVGAGGSSGGCWGEFCVIGWVVGWVLEGLSCDWVGAGRIFFVLIVWVGGCLRDLVCVGGSFV